MRLHCFDKYQAMREYFKEFQGGNKADRIIYNPTYGYEPYWMDGSWVFDDNLPPNTTTTPMPQVCGEECNYLYREVGEVCGRDINNFHYYGCNSVFGCYGDSIDDLAGGFRTYETYCKFLDAQCRRDIHSRLILVHRGPCAKRQDDYFKPLHRPRQPVSRMHKYFTELAELFQNRSLAPLEWNRR